MLHQRNSRCPCPITRAMCCTDVYGLAPMLFVLALTDDPGLLDELVVALLEAHQLREEWRPEPEA